MRKIRLSIFLAAGLWLWAQPTVAADKISIRLWGGWAVLRADEVNAGTRGLSGWAQDYLPVLFPGETVAVSRDDFKKIHDGYEIGGDLVFALNSYFGIGIGAGYLTAKGSSGLGIGRVPPGLGSGGAGISSETRLTAIPIRFGLFVSAPLTGRLRATGNTALGYFFKARYTCDWVVFSGFMDADGPANRVSTVAEKKNGAFGLLGGLGLEYDLSSGLAVLVEAQGRYAKFHGLSGTSIAEATTPGYPEGIFLPFSERGRLYDDTVPLIPNGPRLFMVQSSPPSGPGAPLREAVVDFSGISLRAGVRLRF